MGEEPEQGDDAGGELAPGENQAAFGQAVVDTAPKGWRVFVVTFVPKPGGKPNEHSVAASSNFGDGDLPFVVESIASRCLGESAVARYLAELQPDAFAAVLSDVRARLIGNVKAASTKLGQDAHADCSAERLEWAIAQANSIEPWLRLRVKAPETTADEAWRFEVWRELLEQPPGAPHEERVAFGASWDVALDRARVWFRMQREGVDPRKPGASSRTTLPAGARVIPAERYDPTLDPMIRTTSPLDSRPATEDGA